MKVLLAWGRCLQHMLLMTHHDCELLLLLLATIRRRQKGRMPTTFYGGKAQLAGAGEINCQKFGNKNFTTTGDFGIWDLGFGT